MEPINPFAPPVAPLADPTPPPVRTAVDALWLFPTGLSAGVSVACLILAGYAVVMAIDQYQETGGNWDAGTPIVRRSIIVALAAGVACVAFGVIAHAWHQRRWVRALALMGLFCGFMAILVLAVRGR